MMARSEQPKLSIITINLNNKDGLLKTIESVVNQTSKDFEYVVIDGASVDGSVEALKNFSDRIDVIVSEKDSGIYNAMNKGIQLSKGEYLLFLNSGDWLLGNDVLEKALNLLETEAGISSANIYIDNGHSRTHYPSADTIDFNCLFNGSLPHPSSFIKREMFERHGLYNEANKIVSDWEFFFLTLIIKGEKYLKIPLDFAVFNSSGISNQETMQVIIEKERKEAIERLIPGHLYTEILTLQTELTKYEMLKRKLQERRYMLLEKIEESTLLRSVLTTQMIVLNQFAKLFSKF
jgi:glycosyltransferase involved in cell wall biosynthesis